MLLEIPAHALASSTPVPKKIFLSKHIKTVLREKQWWEVAPSSFQFEANGESHGHGGPVRGDGKKGRWYMIVIPSEKVRSIEADLYSFLHLKYTCTHKIYIQTWPQPFSPDLAATIWETKMPQREQCGWRVVWNKAKIQKCPKFMKVICFSHRNWKVTKE